MSFNFSNVFINSMRRELGKLAADTKRTPAQIAADKLEADRIKADNDKQLNDAGVKPPSGGSFLDAKK